MLRRHPHHLRLWALAGPMILSNLSVPLLGLVDTAVVGHLDSPVYLGAVALGAMIFSFLFWGFGFLRMGTTGLVAQAHGGHDHEGLRLWLGRGLLLALLIGSLLLLLHGPIGRLALGLSGAEGGLAPLTAEYFNVRIWSAPAVLGHYVLLGAFIGMQNSRAPLLLLLVINGLNIILDLLFVVGLEWRVFGVALASTLSEWFGLLLGLWLMRKQLRGAWPWAELLRAAELTRMLRLNLDIFIRTLCLIFAFAFFTRQGAAQGELVLAANALLMNFQAFTAYALDGFAHAAEALVGRALGRRSKRLLKSALRTSLQWSLLFAAAFSLLYLVAGQGIVALLTDIPELRQHAAAYLPWLIASPLISVWSYWLDGVFIGATRSREMRDAMLAALLLVFLPVWYLTQGMGNHGRWLALMVFMGGRGLGLGLMLGRVRV